VRRDIDRRAIFFLVAAVACLLTLTITPSEYRWLGIGLAAVYLVLALVSHLDFRSRIKER
jgi:hypothetical protein